MERNPVNDATDRLNELNIKEGSDDQTTASPNVRVTRAQKRRDKKSREAKERQERIENEDVTELNQARSIEAQKLENILKDKGLKIFDIPSDGDCMYKALEHQLSLHGDKTNVKSLRQETSEFIRKNRDDFIPFLVDEKTGDMMSEDVFKKYCDAIASTNAWGGQIELQALGSILDFPIEIIQAEGKSLVVNESTSNKTKPKLMLSYHRHAYHLGEHYNSLVPK